MGCINLPGIEVIGAELELKARIDRISLSLNDKNFLHISDIIFVSSELEYSIKDLAVKSTEMSSVCTGKKKFDLENWLAKKSSFFLLLIKTHLK